MGTNIKAADLAEKETELTLINHSIAQVELAKASRLQLQEGIEKEASWLQEILEREAL